MRRKYRYVRGMKMKICYLVIFRKELKRKMNYVGVVEGRVGLQVSWRFYIELKLSFYFDLLKFEVQQEVF